MRYSRSVALLLVICCASFVEAQQIILAPSQVTLTGPKAHQQLLVLRRDQGHNTGDLTTQAKFSSNRPDVAQVDEAGVVHPVSGGEAIITAFIGKSKTTTAVRVEKTKVDFTWSFSNHVEPVLTRLGCNSGACHGALAGKGGFKLSLRAYAPADDHFALTRQVRGRRVNTSEPGQSLLLLKPTLAQPHGGGLKLEVKSPDYDLLADWIATGAPGPRDEDVKLEKIEVFPPLVRLKMKDRQRFIVRGWYSDGHQEDVTRWTKFSSTEDLVAGIDESGLADVTGPGEAAITACFANLVATSRITAPYDNPTTPATFAKSPRHNFIDGLVLKKLEELRLPPSPQCNDAEFLRRAYLDAAGILPTPAELDRFLADKRADKRARWIDDLLGRSEFVDYWAYKWSDLLLISSRKLPQPAMRSFYDFVRTSVADNKPWDRFAREILTATGNNLTNGAANYFVLHKDVTDLTESTAVTFLGMGLTCARCHNHPLEKWTQDQYWSLANLFSRVAVKNGDRAGELTIQSQPQGDVLHPRRGVAMKPTPLDATPADEGADRRQVFADWLTAPDNPYFARAVVNRVWRNFLGRGLVEAEDDLRQSNPASNEELFTALADDFVKHRFDMKHLIRGIMNSATYQRSSTPLPQNKNDDRFYSRYLVRRLPAEVVLDAYSAITKVPTSFTKVTVGSSGGQANTGDYPLGTRALELPDTQLVSQFLDAFGRPERGQTCSCERQSESSVTQALHLNNGQTLNDKLRDPKSRVSDWVAEKIDDQSAIDRIFKMALCRRPTAEESARFQSLLREAAADGQTTRREALEDLIWSVLTGREFLFNR